MRYEVRELARVLEFHLPLYVLVQTDHWSQAQAKINRAGFFDNLEEPYKLAIARNEKAFNKWVSGRMHVLTDNTSHVATDKRLKFTKASVEITTATNSTLYHELRRLGIFPSGTNYRYGLASY